jgi:hypothetical protein
MFLGLGVTLFYGIQQYFSDDQSYDKLWTRKTDKKMLTFLVFPRSNTADTLDSSFIKTHKTMFHNFFHHRLPLAKSQLSPCRLFFGLVSQEAT